MRLRDDKGMALPLVLIVMLVVTLLATAVLQFGVVESVQVSRNEKKCRHITWRAPALMPWQNI